MRRRRLLALTCLLALAAGVLAIVLLRRGGGSDRAGPGGGGPGARPTPTVIVPAGQPAPPPWFGQAGIAPRSIAGRVTENGAPVASASVRLTSLLVAVDLAAEEVRTTGVDGRFDFGPRIAAAYGVAATSPGKTGASIELDLRDPLGRPAPDAVELALTPCRASLAGTIRDASGGTIARARVTLHSRQGGLWVESDDAGVYELCVPPGDLWLEVGADGYGTVFLSPTVLGKVVRDVLLTPESVITGRVQRVDGTPVPGALVTASPTEWAEVVGAVRVAVSDGTGAFRLGGVAAGRYGLDAEGEGGATASRVEVAVGAGETAADLVLELVPTVTVRGRVLAEDETPVGGARIGIEVLGQAERSLGAVSQADGTFVLGGVPAGLARFEAAPWELVAPGVLALAAPIADVELRVAPMASIRGRVIARAAPVGGARVYTTNPGARAFDVTAPDGTFVLEGLPAGTYQLSGDSPTVAAFAPPVEVVLAKAEAKEGVTLDLSLAGSIAGVVVDQVGRAVAGAFLRFSLIGGRDFGEATTAPDGAFLAGQLSGGGRYKVQVTASPRAESELTGPDGGRLPPVAVRDGTDRVTGVRFVVRVDRLTIAGRVVDGRGQPVPDVRVRAGAQQPGEGTYLNLWADLPAATTDVDGRFEISELAEGTYTLDARSGAGGQARRQGVLAGARDVGLVLDPPGEIRGTLVGFPAGTTTVAAMPIDRELRPLRGAVTGGGFRVTGLAPGTYVVTALADGLAARTRVDVAARGVTTVTLTAGGTGVIHGRLRRFPDETPQAGASCTSMLGGDEDLPPTSEDQVGGAISGADGTFTLRAPAGPSIVRCGVAGVSRGVLVDPTPVDVPAGGELALELWAIEVEPGPPGRLGLTIDEGLALLIAEGGPAARAGLVPGDVLSEVGGRAVAGVPELIVEIYLGSRPPGTAVPIAVRRAGSLVRVSVTPDAWREEDGLEILGDPDD